MPTIGGSEQTTPTQERVIMLGFSPLFWQLTITAGSGNNIVWGFNVTLDIFRVSDFFSREMF
jgi:hypothetical protein